MVSQYNFCIFGFWVAHAYRHFSTIYPIATFQLLPINDSLTSFKVVAIASSREQFGTGSQSFRNDAVEAFFMEVQGSGRIDYQTR